MGAKLKSPALDKLRKLRQEIDDEGLISNHLESRRNKVCQKTKLKLFLKISRALFKSVMMNLLKFTICMTMKNLMTTYQKPFKRATSISYV